MIPRIEIKQKVDELLTIFDINQPPINVKEVAEALNIDVKYIEFDDKEVSGLLINKDGKVAIGVNITQLPNRQRFTIAHELGHYVLHMPAPVFIDEFQKFRDQLSSEGSKPEEIDANTFAAELLMPEKFVRDDMNNLELWNEENIRLLANKYQVSAESFVYRLSNLGYHLDL